MSQPNHSKARKRHFNIFSTTLSFLRSLFSALVLYIHKVVVTFTDVFLSLNFLLSNMTPCTVDLDDQTTMHYWITNHRRFDKPDLVLVHGYGGHSRWQFAYQVRALSGTFNLYIPDLLFFGKSYTKRGGRSDSFQADCVREGLRKMGLERYNVVGISYGGYVAYQMAANYGEEVNKLVIISSGLCYTEEQKDEHLKKLGNNIYDLLLPQKPLDVRNMIKLAMYKTDPLKWVPDFFVWASIVLGNTNRKEKSELLDHLLARKAGTDVPVLTQETLLIWGDHDNVFPIPLAYQLQRHLGPKCCRIETVKDTGHAANIESPEVVNKLITSFVLGQS
ncbi:hypothetical protein K2173_009664 [Erythroxylum novogranatense]|uniref:AB hydrolase-1 domain-containing protein n=1 Tax=Erythroxylum novogranatense TaxID=1862640 RepID=A0AAV8U7B9_9ROSI|nr:hypothetical protein K2173_009664 [Erythroxylum novogranatense]